MVVHTKGFAQETRQFRCVSVLVINKAEAAVSTGSLNRLKSAGLLSQTSEGNTWWPCWFSSVSSAKREFFIDNPLVRVLHID
jgi:hypothetical protein